MNLEAVSKYHTYVALSVLVSLLSWFLLRGFPSLRFGVLVALSLGNIWFCHGLARALGKWPWMWTVLCLSGYFVFWVPQLLLVNAANQASRATGWKIGFLGGASSSSTAPV